MRQGYLTNSVEFEAEYTAESTTLYDVLQNGQFELGF